MLDGKWQLIDGKSPERLSLDMPLDGTPLLIAFDWEPTPHFQWEERLIDGKPCSYLTGVGDLRDVSLTKVSALFSLSHVVNNWPTMADIKGKGTALQQFSTLGSSLLPGQHDFMTPEVARLGLGRCFGGANQLRSTSLVLLGPNHGNFTRAFGHKP